MHILITVNAAWNIWNFRRPLVKALLEAGHRVTILAPEDEKVEDLRAMGCRFVILEMDVKGLNPLQDYKLMRRFTRVFRAEAPDVVLSYARRSSDVRLYAALLRMMRHNEREERALGRGRHKLLKRYAREAKSQRRRAFQAWLACLGEDTKEVQEAA